MSLLETREYKGKKVYKWVSENHETKEFIFMDDLDNISSKLEPPVIQWRTRDEKPKDRIRIAIYSPIYPEDSGMRKRIIDSQFLELCREATHWGYISEPPA